MFSLSSLQVVAYQCLTEELTEIKVLFSGLTYLLNGIFLEYCVRITSPSLVEANPSEFP